MHISPKAYAALVAMAGGERKITRWIETAILNEAKAREEVAIEDAVANARNARDALDRMLKQFGKGIP